MPITTRTRRANAKSSYKAVTHQKRRIAAAAENQIAKILGTERLGDKSPLDLAVKIGGRLHGIEVKTAIDNSNAKITVHPESRREKEQWAHKKRAVLHTVVVLADTRAMLYREGVGSFRLHKMQPVRSPAHLRALLAA